MKRTKHKLRKQLNSIDEWMYMGLCELIVPESGLVQNL